MDALSETLKAVRLLGPFFIQARFTAPWSCEAPCVEAMGALQEPGATRAVVFHLVTEGECFVTPRGKPPVRLAAGDVVLFPKGGSHVLSSAPGLVPAVCNLAAGGMSGQPFQVEHGGGGTPAHIVSGYLACDGNSERLLLGSLPCFIHLGLRGSATGAWLENSLCYALAEAMSPRPGAAGVLSRLSELVFIEILRLFMAEQAPEQAGWLAGINDPLVGAALNSIHNSPGRTWVLEDLARSAGTSRSVLAKRFKGLVGMGPMAYLTQWRMLVAANMLAQSRTPIGLIASKVGYETDTAFSRAFSREYGAPPHRWRREQGSKHKSEATAAAGRAGVAS